MDCIILFVPFIFAFGMYCANDPLTRRFWDEWERCDRDA